jgi:hypothetical protein
MSELIAIKTQDAPGKFFVASSFTTSGRPALRQDGGGRRIR